MISKILSYIFFYRTFNKIDNFLPAVDKFKLHRQMCDGNIEFLHTQQSRFYPILLSGYNHIGLLISAISANRLYVGVGIIMVVIIYLRADNVKKQFGQRLKKNV